MIPQLIARHLRERHAPWQHHVHRRASSAQRLAAEEHASGHRVAKGVVVRIGGEMAIAVVSAAQQVCPGTLEAATGLPVELVPEWEFSEVFEPCEPGAEPPLALFGLPIWVDAELLRQSTLLMPAGTHEDAVVVDTDRWANCERVRALRGLGTPAGSPAPHANESPRRA